MKYIYTPNCHIIDYENLKEMFCFNENGVFETNDPKLIKWIKENKNFLKPVEETPIKEKPQEIKKVMMKCKKCNFETENKGELMAHYREHKKDGE